ncbi:hypothetical protein BJ684DRAFT_14971 [Piptocephalis cylindrospora]|uniref:Phosphatidate phosphatase APP1 catalytic domain-containing protein n=1 Tax=Piptocephalis cylindrospora TaxID=1907219 RepID=A0A4P9Y7C1_9FUNG|nr:hypothetical protein BJ684DRAFT_14971 [Piptocephalis cylindrospora]|eukprot:RKP14712.1 hypothetical protein BJ684DRAFT_14971 [Piptocephalis cylindrospora]
MKPPSHAFPLLRLFLLLSVLSSSALATKHYTNDSPASHIHYDLDDIAHSQQQLINQGRRYRHMQERPPTHSPALTTSDQSDYSHHMYDRGESPIHRPSHPSLEKQLKHGLTPEAMVGIAMKRIKVLKELAKQYIQKEFETAPLVRVNISPGFLALTAKNQEKKTGVAGREGWKARGIVEGIVLNDRSLHKFESAMGAIALTNLFPLVRRALGPWFYQEALETRKIWRKRSAYMMARPYRKLSKNFDICIAVPPKNPGEVIFAERIKNLKYRDDVDEIKLIPGTRPKWEANAYFRAEISFSMDSFMYYESKVLHAYAAPKGAECSAAYHDLHWGADLEEVKSDRERREKGKKKDAPPTFLSVPGTMTLSVDSPLNTIIISDLDDCVLNSKMLQTQRMVAQQAFENYKVLEGASDAFRIMGNRITKEVRESLKEDVKGITKVIKGLEMRRKIEDKLWPYSLPNLSTRFVSAGSILMVPLIAEVLKEEGFQDFSLHMNPIMMTSWSVFPDMYKAAHPYKFKGRWFKEIEHFFPKSRKYFMEDSAQVGPEVLAKAYSEHVKKSSSVHPNWRILIRDPWPQNKYGEYFRFKDLNRRQKKKVNIETIRETMGKYGVPPSHYYIFTDWYEHVLFKGIGVVPLASPGDTSAQYPHGTWKDGWHGMEDFTKKEYTHWDSMSHFIEERESTFASRGLLAPPRDQLPLKGRISATSRSFRQSCIDMSLSFFSSFFRVLQKAKRAILGYHTPDSSTHASSRSSSPDGRRYSSDEDVSGRGMEDEEERRYEEEEEDGGSCIICHMSNNPHQDNVNEEVLEDGRMREFLRRLAEVWDKVVSKTRKPKRSVSSTVSAF